MVKVSVLCPVYNAERYLADAIASVQSQTFRDFELILFDDGSTDSSFEVMKQFAEKDSRIKIVSGGVNRGALFVRNALIQLASGEFCAWIDSDDMMEANFLNDALDLQRQGDYDMIQFGNAQCRDDQGNEPMQLTHYDGFVYMGNFFLLHFLPYLYAYRFSLWSRLIRTSVMKQAAFQLPEKRYITDDPFFAASIFLAVKRFLYYDGKAYYRYRVGNGMWSGHQSEVSLKRLRGLCELVHDVLAHWLKVLHDTGRYQMDHIKVCCENCMLQEAAEMVYHLPEEQRADGEALFRTYFCENNLILNGIGPHYPGFASRLDSIMHTGTDPF